MPGMILYIDDFGEGDLIERGFDLDAEQVAELLEESGYRGPTGLRAEIIANRVGTTIRVRGSVAGEIEYECGRCLETRAQVMEVDTHFVLMESSEFESTYRGEEIELDADDMDVSVYSGDEIDIAPLVREAILLELPTMPRCSDELRAACDEAFERNIGEDAKKELEEAAMDQRWAALKDLKLKD